MRKAISALLAVALVTLTIGCGGSSATKTNTAPKAGEQKTQAAPVSPPAAPTAPK